MREETIIDILKFKKKWTYLQSSHIQACLYFRRQPKENGLLAIMFSNDTIYLYHPVPWSTYLRFRHAESHGSFFSRHIKDNPKIQYQQVA